MKHYTFMERYHLVGTPALSPRILASATLRLAKQINVLRASGYPKARCEFHTLASTHVIRSDKSCENLTTAS